jgi:UDPglucose 6-dehydrogenase
MGQMKISNTSKNSNVSKISIVGAGYVGLSTGVGFAKKGHSVICVDIDEKKIESINRGHPPIYEPGMADGLKEAVTGGRLRATADLKGAIMDSDVTFVSVPTPQSDDGSADLSYIRKAAEDIGSVLREKGGYHVVVVKSTVVPGTTEGTVLPALENGSGKKAGSGFGLCMNPEFLREGRALEDFLDPDRVVIGSLDSRAGDVVEGVYNGFDAPVLRTAVKTAEMIKYASNALLATKISFSNEIGNICKELGIDVYDVMKGVGMDGRLSPSFLQAGTGFGGSCFPKDVAAIAAKGRELGQETRILSAVLDVNKSQRQRIVGLLEKKAGGLEGKRVAVLGLAFKPHSDDVREAPSIDIIRMLNERDAHVSAYDPKAMGGMKAVHPGIEYCDKPADCLKAADACLILTDWSEFKGLSEKDFDAMNAKVIIEGRKVLNPGSVKCFEGICWP